MQLLAVAVASTVGVATASAAAVATTRMQSREQLVFHSCSKGEASRETNRNEESWSARGRERASE